MSDVSWSLKNIREAMSAKKLKLVYSVIVSVFKSCVMLQVDYFMVAYNKKNKRIL